MKMTIIITASYIKRWWRELTPKRHAFVIFFLFGLIFAFGCFVYWVHSTSQTKNYYREKVDENTEQIQDLKKQNNDKQ